MTVGTNFILGGLKRNTSEVNKKRGSGGLPPGKFSMIPPFRLLENDPFLENVPLRETKRIMTNGRLFKF